MILLSFMLSGFVVLTIWNFDDGQVSLLTFLEVSACCLCCCPWHPPQLECVVSMQNSSLLFFQSCLTTQEKANGIHFWLTCKSLHLPSQSSVLDPILFVLYTNYHNFDRHSVSHSEFSNDSQLYDSVPHEQLDWFVTCSLCSWCKTRCHKTNYNPVKGKLRCCSLILKTGQTFHSESKFGQNETRFSGSVWNLVWFLTVSCLQNDRFVKFVSLNHIDVAQWDISSQLKLPKPLSCPWYHHVLTTVTLSCQEFLNSSLTNFKRFRIALLDWISKPTNARISPLLAELVDSIGFW